MNADQIDQLIARFFAGEASKEECTKLELWRQASPQNETLFQESKHVWDSSVAHQPDQPFDVEKGWRDLQLRLHAEPLERDSARIITWSATKASKVLFLGVAASFLIGFLLLVFYQIHLRPKVLRAEDGLLETRLPDGSRLHLRKGSQLSWVGNPEKGPREFKLTGQALFEVAKTSQPFLVHTSHGKVEVLGTVFSVRTYGDYTEVYVKQGRVAFSTVGVDKVMKLEVGEIGRIEPSLSGSYYDLSKISHERNDNVLEGLNSKHLAWLNGSIYFDSTALHNVVDELSAFYDQPIILADDPALASKWLSGTFSEMELEKILEEISLTLQLKYQARAEGGYILSSK